MIASEDKTSKVNILLTKALDIFDIITLYKFINTERCIFMKRTLALILAIIMISALAIGVSASDDAKLKIYNAAKDACPEAYRDQYLRVAQSALDQISVTDEQATKVVALINEGKAKFADKGSMLTNYTAEERKIAVALVNDACKELNLTAKIVTINTTGDVKFDIYNQDKVIASLNGTPIKVTGGLETTGYTPAVIAVVLTIIGLAGTVVLRKREF